MIVYSTEHCPMCAMLKTKLDAAGIEYEVCMDIDKMNEMNIQHVPVLEDNGNLMNLAGAIQYIDQIVEQRGVSDVPGN